jgi:hypothetical protein
MAGTGALALVGVAASVLGTSTSAHAATVYTSPVPAGTQLNPDDSIVTPYGQFHLHMQTDGNLVLYSAGGQVQWRTDTHVAGSRCHIQTDGNIVIYDPDNNVQWRSGTGGNTGGSFHLGNDGNVVYYDPSNNVIWNADCVYDTMYPGEQLHNQWMLRKYGYRLVMQGDGNLVLLKESTMTPVWDANTNVNPGAYAALQGDGNFVVYSAANAALWNSKTSHTAVHHLTIDQRGAVTIYDVDGNITWSSIPTSTGGAGTLASVLNEAWGYKNKTLQELQSGTGARGQGLWPGGATARWNTYGGDWCAVFMSELLRNNNIPFNPSSYGIYNEFPARYSTPKAGDLIYYVSSATSGHVGLVVSVTNGVAQTLEGNCTDDPNKVHYHSEPWTTVVGYGRPAYAS